MRLPIPSTLQAARSIMGKAEEKELQTGVKLVRETETRISLFVDGSDILAFDMNPDTGAQTVELALGDSPSSRMVGIARVALSATGSWIRKASETSLDKTRAMYEAVLADESDPALRSVIEHKIKNLRAGLFFYAPASGAKKLQDGIVAPVLA